MKTKNPSYKMLWIYFVYGEKIFQNLYQKRKVKVMCSDTLNGKNLRKICVTLQQHRLCYVINEQL